MLFVTYLDSVLHDCMQTLHCLLCRIVEIITNIENQTFIETFI